MAEELTKIPLKLKETKLSGGGAQIEFIPFDDEDLGLRVYKDTEFPKTISAVETAKRFAESFRLRWALAECLLSFNLPEEVQAATPKIVGIGLYVPKEEGSFYFEAIPQTMKGEGIYEALSYIYSEGSDLAVKGIESNIFTLVERVPIAKWGDENPDVFYSPRRLAESDPKAYRQGLINGLKFYQAARNFGMWNFDIRDKDPFFCDRQGNLRVIDTSGFQALRRSEAEGLMRGFYEREMTKLEKAIRDKTIESQPDPLKPEEREEYDKLSEQIEELSTEGQELLSSLEIDEKIAKYGEVERRLKSKEAGFVLESIRRKSAEERLEELQAKKAEAQRQKELKTQAAEVDVKINAAERRLRDANSPYKRLLAMEELRRLATEVITKGEEDLDRATFRKLSDLGIDTEIRSKYGYPNIAYCRDALEEVKALEEEKPLPERKEEAQVQIESVEAELEELREEKEAFGKIPAHIFEPSDYEIERAREEIERLRTDEGIEPLKEEMVRVRKIIEQIRKHSSLGFKVRYSREQAEKKAAAIIDIRRSVLFEEELPKSTNRDLTQANIGELLKECGFETFLEAIELDELKSFYEKVKSGRYPINDPRMILNIFVSQLEGAKIS